MHPFKHLKTVLKHKWFVFIYACKLGIPIRGILHDLSKFSFTEFYLSSKYYAGDKSPTILERKDNNNISRITLHHAVRQNHHWHHYVDYLDDGFIIAPMPYKYALEYVCDSISANRVYNKKLDLDNAYDYYYNHSKTYVIHPGTKEFVLWSINEIRTKGFKVMKKKYTKANFIRIMNKYDKSVFIPFNNFSLDYLKLKNFDDNE